MQPWEHRPSYPSPMQHHAKQLAALAALGTPQHDDASCKKVGILEKKTVNKILTKTRVCWAQGSVRFCEPETALPCSGCSQSWACWWRRLALELCTSSHINQPESRSASPKHHHHLYHHHNHHHHHHHHRHHQQHYPFPYMLSCCHRNTRHRMTRPRAHVQVIMKSPVLELYALIFSSLGSLWFDFLRPWMLVRSISNLDIKYSSKHTLLSPS